jgi:hypothetical protein
MVTKIVGADRGATLSGEEKNGFLLSSDGFVVATQATTTRGGGRPARLYRSGPATELAPPIRRPGD